MALLKYPILNNLTSPDAANTELKQVKRQHSIFFAWNHKGTEWLQVYLSSRR